MKAALSSHNLRWMTLLLMVGSSFAANAPQVTVRRWSEGQPGCTFSADDDGRYRYGLWTDDFGVVVAVDSQEMQKSIRRTEPTFAVMVTVHYRGKSSLAFDPAAITLEFVKHFHDVHRALDPEKLAVGFQSDVDRFAEKTAREIQKHPEKKTTLEAELQQSQQNLAEMLAFLRSRSLRAVTIDSTHSEANGWIYFSARGKWLSQWEKQEEFILRIPLHNQTIEFPFALPESFNDLRLRRR